MGKKCFTTLLLILWFACATPLPGLAQEATARPSATEQADKDKAALEEKAVALLEQVVSESGSLRLPENRIRIQIIAADLLWARKPESARALFTFAAAILNEGTGRPTTTNNRRGGNPNRLPAQLRQELVLTAARHDATLAYQLLHSTKQTALSPTAQSERGQDSEANLEQRLIAQIAGHDPLLALQSAEAWIDKGQYPNALAQVLAQLQLKDKAAATKFSEKLLKRLQSENLLAKQDAANLTLSLLRPGPRPAEDATNGGQAALANAVQTLTETAFKELLDAAITAALKAAPPAATTSRGRDVLRGRGNRSGSQETEPPTLPDAAQMEQSTARGLLMGLQSLLPHIEKYAPLRANAVRQKMAQMGVSTERRFAFGQLSALIEQGTADSLLAAAQTAPPNLQAAIYQEAAMKALDEGQIERARQIATDHLNPTQRSTVLQMADIQQAASKGGGDVLESVRHALLRLPSDEERLTLLIQLANTLQTGNQELALQLLGEAQRMVSGRVTNYQQFDWQLKIAQAFAAFDPARGFEVLEPGILQLNELLSAAALLSGFEVTIFRDGELPYESGSRLSNVVNEFAEELAALAKSDFERAQLTAERFQLSEARIFTRLAIARALLGEQPLAGSNRSGGIRGFGFRRWQPE